MEINLSKQTATAPAPFGMSVCGHATGSTSGSTTGSTFGAFAGRGMTTVSRDRVLATQGVIGFAVPAYVPGTSAWSPPVS